MSTLELAQKIESLSEEDFQLICALVNKLSNKQNPFPVMNEESLVVELSQSIEQSDKGMVKPARAFVNEITEQYEI